MILKKIEITNFRNYQKLSLNFDCGINIICGNNAQGKTNLLESIYVLAITKSHRSFIDNNLIKTGEKKAKIKGIIEVENIKTKLEVNIENKNKKLKIDDNEIKKISDYISKMNIIIFYPEDLELIKGSPSIRRRYINLELSQINNRYLNVLNDYNKLLKIRNDCLKKMQKNIKLDGNYFNIVTVHMVEKAVLIYKMRQSFINKINNKCEQIYSDITGIGKFNIKYRNFLDLETNDDIEIKTKIEEKLNRLYQNEIRIGSTLFGPHRDDFDFCLGDLNLKNYGSQGQQRVAVLALKLSEIDIFKNNKSTEPILLLDDVFSELDDIKKNNLLKYINKNIQTFITTTELKNIEESIVEKSKIILIDNGSIIEKNEV